MELMEWLDKGDKPRKSLLNNKYLPHIVVGGVCLITLIWGILYTVISKTVYFWDDATYWEISRMLMAKPLNLQFFKDVYTSIITADYNYLSAVPVSLWMKIFGGTRVSYIIAITLMYLIPSEIMTYKLCYKISKAPWVAFLITVLSIPSVLYLTFIGFIDIGGVLIGVSCYYLYYTDTFKKRLWAKYVILGILLGVIMLFRRYFAFFAVSFITAMIIDIIIFRRSPRGVIITLLTVAGVIGILFFPFVLNILLKDYGTMYSGYKYNIFTDLKLITRYFGILFIIMAFSAVPFIVKQKRDTRCLMPILQILICWSMFVTTQTHGQQHLLLYVPGFIALIILGLNGVRSYVVFTGVCLITAITFISPFIPRKQPDNIQQIKGLALAPTYSVKAEKREDINHLVALKSNLDRTIPEGKICGVLSSSFTLNASVLLNVEPSLNREQSRTDGYIVGLPEVDSRDWWRLDELYSCDYILVATPAQTHLAEGQQTIITEAVNSFINNTDFAKAYSKVYGFSARIGNVEVQLYRRYREVTKTEQAQFKTKLNLGEG